MTHLANKILEYANDFECLENGRSRWLLYADTALRSRLCGRYEIGDDILEAAKQVVLGKSSSLLGAMPLARPTHHVTWIEWVVCPGTRRGWLIVQMPKGVRSGDDSFHALKYELIDGSIMLPLFSSIIQAAPMAMPLEIRESLREQCNKQIAERTARGDIGRYKPTAADVEAHLEIISRLNCVSIEPDGTMATLEPQHVLNAHQHTMDLIIVLLLINSKNAVSVGEDRDMSKVNKARNKAGKSELLSLRPVILDITRKQRAARRAGVQVRPEEIRASLVRGHFKVRKTGVYWWSSYVRSGYGEVAGRDYIAR